jgi:hypothetical protein
MKNLDQDTDPNSDLKVLSSEMDPAESRLIRQVFTKERGTEVFRKIRLSPILSPVRQSRDEKIRNQLDRHLSFFN